MSVQHILINSQQTPAPFAMIKHTISIIFSAQYSPTDKQIA